MALSLRGSDLSRHPFVAAPEGSSQETRSRWIAQEKTNRLNDNHGGRNAKHRR
jgi:hypothetical protein